MKPWLALGAGALLIWWLATRNASAPPPAGTPTYKVAAGGAPYWMTDPSAAGAAAQAGTLAAGTTVYATSMTPLLSSDSSYELVNAPGIGNVWVGIGHITVA